MYDSADDFYNKVDEDIRDIGLELNSIGKGIFYFIGFTDDFDILVECGMNSIDKITYNPYTTINDLLESDFVRIYFDKECVLWVG